MGVIWTREGTQRLMHSNGQTIMELPDSIAGVSLVLAYSVKIEPGGQRTVPLLCTRKLVDQMDIRINTGFHHRNPNVHIAPSCGENPENAFDPKYITITIFNLSHVDHLYIGRDTVLLLQMSQQWTYTMWNLPVKTKSRSTLLNQGTGYHNVTKHCLKYKVTLLLSVHLQMYQATGRFISRTKKSQQTVARDLKSCMKSTARHFQSTMRTLAEPSLSRWT